MPTTDLPALTADIVAFMTTSAGAADLPLKAEQLAKAIDDHIVSVVSKSTATVNVPGTGLVAPSGGGPVTGQATGAITPGDLTTN